MELQKFIEESLCQIVNGVNAAQNRAGGDSDTINPKVAKVFTQSSSGGTNLALGWTRKGELIHVVDFDVAVVAEEGSKTKGGIGIFTGLVGAGSQGASEASNSNHSRIKFRVPIALPIANGSKEEDAAK